MARVRVQEDWPNLLADVLAGRAEGLYLAYCATVRPLLVNRLGQDAEDAMHEGFLRLLRAVRRGAIRDPWSVGKYCLLIAANEAHEIHRRRARHPEGAMPTRHADEPDFRNPERQAIASQLVSQALAVMTEDEREVCCDDRFDSEVAAERGCSKSTVWTMRSKAREKARRVLPQAA